MQAFSAARAQDQATIASLQSTVSSLQVSSLLHTSIGAHTLLVLFSVVTGVRGHTVPRSQVSGCHPADALSSRPNGWNLVACGTRRTSGSIGDSGEARVMAAADGDCPVADGGGSGGGGIGPGEAVGIALGWSAPTAARVLTESEPVVACCWLC